MSFLTEYFDEYREQPIRKTKMCRPEERWAKIQGNWLDPKTGAEDRKWTKEEIQKFIKDTMRSLRGQSTYFNEHCAHLDQSFKTRPFVPRVKKRKTCKELEEAVEEEEPVAPPLEGKLAIKDTELMKTAHDYYERDMNKPTLEPLPTHFRSMVVQAWCDHGKTMEAAKLSKLLGYVRPCLFKTGMTEYQGGIARLAYEMIRDDRLPKYQAHNGGRPKWGYPPEGTRQPPLDGIPLDGERLY